MSDSSQSPSVPSSPNYSPPKHNDNPSPTAFPAFIPFQIDSEPTHPPLYTPPRRRRPKSLPSNDLRVSRASRQSFKRTTQRRIKTNLRHTGVTHLDAVAQTEDEIRRNCDLFTFHKQYLPFKPPWRKKKKIALFGDPDPHIKEYWEAFPHPPVDKDPSTREFLKSCVMVQMHHLFLFNKPSHRMPTSFLPAWKKAITVVEGLLTLPEKLKFPTVDDLQYVRFDPKKFAGIEYARRGLRSRGDAHSVALQDAKEAWVCLMAGQRVAPQDVRLGGKGKIRDKAPPGTGIGDNLVGRLILMMSHRDLLLLGAVEQPLTEGFLDEKFPIALGFRWCHGGPTKFADRLNDFHRYYCLDAFKFDANITDWLTVAALRILRKQFIDGESPQYDAYWEFVQESLIRAVIQTDDGVRMQKFQGSTSGHNFNSLVQSIITLLVGYTTFFQKAPDATATEAKKNAFFLALGDELLVALNRPYSSWSVKDIAEIALEGCGIDWGGSKSYSTTTLVDEHPGQSHGVLFLGKRMRLDQFWVRGKRHDVVTPYRPFRETVEGLYYPHRFPGNREDAIFKTYERTLAAYIDAAGNPETRRWLDGLLGWLEGKGAKPPDGWDADQEHTFIHDIERAQFPVPNPERWDLQHWMEFTHLPRTNPMVESRHQRRRRMDEKRERIRFRWARLGLRGGQQQRRYLYP